MEQVRRVWVLGVKAMEREQEGDREDWNDCTPNATPGHTARESRSRPGHSADLHGVHHNPNIAYKFPRETACPDWSPTPPLPQSQECNLRPSEDRTSCRRIRRLRHRRGRRDGEDRLVYLTAAVCASQITTRHQLTPPSFDATQPRSRSCLRGSPGPDRGLEDACGLISTSSGSPGRPIR